MSVWKQNTPPLGLDLLVETVTGEFYVCKYLRHENTYQFVGVHNIYFINPIHVKKWALIKDIK